MPEGDRCIWYTAYTATLQAAAIDFWVGGGGVGGGGGDRIWLIRMCQWDVKIYNLIDNSE